MAAAFLGASADACPSAVFNVELDPLIDGSRQNVRVFAKNRKTKTWQEVSWQLDPVSEDGRFIFYKDENWRKEPVDKFDRLVMAPEDFGLVRGPGERLPCRGPVVYQLEDKQAPGNFAYLTSCPGVTRPEWNQPSAVAWIKDANALETERYRYEFNPKNNMLFRTISLSGAGDTKRLVARDSELLIKSDVKRFFTMHFDSDDIESYLETTRPGPVGTLARVSFYLRILFFKIKMSLTTDVTFYEESGHIPMMVHLPVEAQRHLNPSSGILYSWALADGVTVDLSKMDMPSLDAEKVKSGFRKLSETGLNRCRGDSCRYRFVATTGVGPEQRELAMEFDIGRSLVEKGFFPHFVHDVAAFNETMKWDIHENKLKFPRMGLYFEVSGLPAGGSPWDFWLRLGPPQGKVRGDCPRGLSIRRVSS